MIHFLTPTEIQSEKEASKFKESYGANCCFQRYSQLNSRPHALSKDHDKRLYPK